MIKAASLLVCLMVLKLVSARVTQEGLCFLGFRLYIVVSAKVARQKLRHDRLFFALCNLVEDMLC